MAEDTEKDKRKKHEIKRSFRRRELKKEVSLFEIFAKGEKIVYINGEPVLLDEFHTYLKKQFPLVFIK